MAHKSYKLVQKQRQTEKERNKNIQHTTSVDVHKAGINAH